MKLCRFGVVGAERPGIIDTDNIIRDLSSEVSDIDGLWLESGGMDMLNNVNVSELEPVDPSVRLGVPIARVGKIVCAGMNYSDHCEEAGFPIPEQPALFMKANSSLSGPNDDILRPPGCQQLDWEVELAAVVGRHGKNISEDDALDYVAGYTILNDVSDRDFQFNHGGQWFKGKSADTFCPVGPWLVSKDEIADPQALDLYLNVNGQRMQSGNTSKMIFSLANLISHISNYMSLAPGDIISTGTPPGVGMGQKPEPAYLSDGDIISMGITGLGEMTQRVVVHGGTQ